MKFCYISTQSISCCVVLVLIKEFNYSFFFAYTFRFLKNAVPTTPDNLGSAVPVLNTIILSKGLVCLLLVFRIARVTGRPTKIENIKKDYFCNLTVKL